MKIFNRNLTILLLSLMPFIAMAQHTDHCDPMTPFGKPIVVSIEPITRLCRGLYLVEHSPSRKTAYWSAEYLTRSASLDTAVRVNAFKADPDLPKPESATPSDYNKSGYDQGHLAPVGDMHSDSIAMLESFYMSNMVPQNPTNNRNGWNGLEYYTRGLAIKNGSVYVITGPVYNCAPCKTIGRSKVAVPTHLYKIVYVPSRKVTISFMVPNIPFTKSQVSQFITTREVIEQATGIKFFPTLDVQLDEMTALL